jgi:hypothetical protein
MVKKECAKCDFSQNPVKAEARLHINSFLMGSLFTVLALLWTLSSEKVSSAITLQMVLAIPLILFASLSYAKTGYERTHKIWDNFGWVTNNIGYLLFLNATGLMVIAFSSRIIGFIYFASVIILTSLYYVLNIISQPGTLKEHLYKMIFWLIIIFIGGILPAFI